MDELTARAGPDTGLPAGLEIAVAILFYLGPLLFAALAWSGYRCDGRGRLVSGLGLLAASVYTEAAFLDLACSPDGAGCAWLERQLPVAAIAGAVGAAALLLALVRRPGAAIGVGGLSLLLGSWVTLGYLARVI